MELLFSLIFITSIWVLGIKIATSTGMIFEKYGNFANKKVEDGNKIYEALLVCPYCMPSIHSIFGFLFSIGIGVIETYSWRILFYYPLCVVGSSLVCGLVWQFHTKQNTEKDFFESATNAADAITDSIYAPHEEEEYEEEFNHQHN